MIDKNTVENALIIFIKNPQLGKVKTRLAKTVGNEKALEIYLELSKITRENCQILSQRIPSKKGQSDIQPYVFYSDFINTNDDWSNGIFKKAVQSGEGLGDRMSNAFLFILQNHAKACIIGSDCPTLSVAILESAFEALDNHDFVVGPSTDGGYYLLGMNGTQDRGFRKSDFGFRDTLPKSEIRFLKLTPPQYLFENMVWSTENVLPETLHRIKAQGKTVALLPELTDVDEEKDWLNYLKIEEES